MGGGEGGKERRQASLKSGERGLLVLDEGVWCETPRLPSGTVTPLLRVLPW